MKAFTLFLMIAVTGMGVLGGYRTITGKDLISPDAIHLSLPGGDSGSPTPVPPTATPTVPPTSTPMPTATPRPAPATATPMPDRPQTMVVGNTDGMGVYVRRTPHMADKLRAWVDGTVMEITGPNVESEGQQWAKVRSPDGVDGYVPLQYLVNP